LALELASRDVKIERDTKGKLVALHFGNTYQADVKEATTDANLFTEEYSLAAAANASLGGKSNRPSSAYIKALSNVPSSTAQASRILTRLPKETMFKANIDLDMLSNTSKRLSYLSQPRLWCTNSR
jgi:hypothetical protein